MIGYHAIPVIVDAYMKGIRDYDAELALEAPHRGLDLAPLLRAGVLCLGEEPLEVVQRLERALELLVAVRHVHPDHRVGRREEGDTAFPEIDRRLR